MAYPRDSRLGPTPVEINGRTVAAFIPEPQEQPNPLQRALNDYHLMEREKDAAVGQAADLRATNGALVAEVNMLREALERADGDRIRLQAISSTLLGRLLAINDTIAGAVRAAVKDGIDASTPKEPEPALSEPAEAPQSAPEPVAPEQPLRVLSTPVPPVADWSRLPQG